MCWSVEVAPSPKSHSHAAGSPREMSATLTVVRSTWLRKAASSGLAGSWPPVWPRTALPLQYSPAGSSEASATRSVPTGIVCLGRVTLLSDPR